MQHKSILGEIMTTNESFPVRVDANGDPDVGYYLARAHEMRGEAIREGAKAISKAVVGWLANLVPHAPGTPIHH
jgi:hypothetical protein